MLTLVEKIKCYKCYNEPSCFDTKLIVLVSERVSLQRHELQKNNLLKFCMEVPTCLHFERVERLYRRRTSKHFERVE